MQILTDAFIAKLTATAARIEIADARCIGLAIRVTATGAKSFSFKYRARGHGVQRVTLGSYPDLSLAKARAAANKMREAVVDGKDPATDRREERTGGRTFGGLATRYLREHALRHKRPASAAGDERNLRLHVLPKWAKRDYLTIQRADVVKLVEGVIATGKDTLANRVHALVSKIFSFAVDAGLRTDNPCARMKQRGVENVGNRVLSDDEIRLFWSNAIEPADARRLGLGLRLALLTGARAGEVTGLARTELQAIDDPHGAAWLIPGTRAKNKRPHLIPLCPLARATVLELLAMSGGEFLFQSPMRSGPIHASGLANAMAYFGLRLARGDYGQLGEAAATWTATPPSPHDCRRTVETRLAALGVPAEYRDRILNHVPRGVGAKHYNLHDYAAEKKAALLRWEAALAMILAGDAGGALIAFADRKAAQNG